MEGCGNFTSHDSICGPEIWESFDNNSVIQKQSLTVLKSATSEQDKYVISELEIQLQNERLETQSLRVNLESQEEEIRDLHTTVLELRERLEEEKFNANIERQKFKDEINFQANELKILKEEMLQLRSKCATHEEKPSRKNSQKENGLKKLFLAPQFKNTQKYAIAFVIENITLTRMKLQENYFCWSAITEYEKIAAEIPAGDTLSFGFTGGDDGLLSGFFCYRIFDMLFLVRYDVNSSCNHVALALCPTNVESGADLWHRLCSPDGWSGCADRVYKDERAGDFAKDKTLNSSILLGKLQATAFVKTGKKAWVTVKIWEGVEESNTKLLI